MRPSFIPPRGSIHPRLTLALAVAATAPGADAQVPFHTFQSSLFSQNADFGSAILPLSDLDGDGVRDVLIASARYGPGNGGQVRGRVRVLSGASPAVVLQDFVGGGFGCGIGNVLRADYLCSTENAMARIGELDGDGHPDFAIAATNYNASCSALGLGRAYLQSGGAQANLSITTGPQTFGALGTALAGVGDQNGDGTPDVAIGIPGLDTLVGADAGEVRVISGAAPYDLLFTVDAPEASAGFGRAIAALGDLTGDGVPEFLVGAPGDDDGVVIDAGSVSVVLGGTRSILFQVFGDAADAGLGTEVRLAGDADGDFAPDFLASCAAAVEQVHLFSTFGQRLGVLSAPVAATDFGTTFTGVGDVDGDGRIEIAVGAPLEDGGLGASQGAVHLFSFVSGSIVHESTLVGFAAGDRFGSAIADLGSGPVGSPVPGGDWNGDGLADLLVGAPGAFDARGAVYVMPALCLGPVRYCSAPVNSTGVGARIDSSGSLSVAANDFVLIAEDLPLFQPGLFYYGTFPLDLPFGCGRRCVGGTLVRFAPQNSSTVGSVQRAVDWSAEGLVPFDLRYVQFWYRDPAGASCGSTFNLSDALELRLCR